MDMGPVSPLGEEDARWLKSTALKRSVSLPAISKDNRGQFSSMWQKAEGSSSPGGSSHGSDEGRIGQEILRTVSAPLNKMRFAVDIDLGEGRKDSGKAHGDGDKRAKSSKLVRNIDLNAKESAHADKRRQLKAILREQRAADRSLSCSKHLVGFLSKSKDGPYRRKMCDQQKMQESVSRIAGHIHGCSHARHDLQELSKKMAMVCAPPSATAVLSGDLKHAFADAIRKTHQDD